MTPRPIRRPFPKRWYLNSPGYRMFMIRELTAFFIAGYLVFFLYWLHKLGQGEDTFATFMEALRSPLSVLLHAVVLAAALIHTCTWFNLTPKIMPVYLGEERVAGPLLAIATGYGPWLVVTGVILWRVLA